MPGTGIHGYTGTSANGLYNISNGIIQSSAPSTNANNISYGNYGNSVSTATGNAIANAITSAQNNVATSLAQQVAGKAGTDATAYGDMIREILANAQANTAQSQAFAREQMDFQRKSDATAMAWSAQEAEKNRAWQESLADTAHQREVRDLVAAGLNPILSANAGAYTGSGATGQGFSSSGAMGSVDTSVNNALGGMVSSMINSASNAQVAKLYTDAEKYSADLQYSASRLNTEASIANNQNSTSAQKWIASQQMINDLEKTKLAGEYGLANTGLSNSGAMERAQFSEGMANFRSLNSEAQQNYRTEATNASNEAQNAYRTDYGSFYSGGPWHKIAEDASTILGNYTDKIKKLLGKSHGRASSYDSPSSMLKDVGWG